MPSDPGRRERGLRAADERRARRRAGGVRAARRRSGRTSRSSRAPGRAAGADALRRLRQRRALERSRSRCRTPSAPSSTGWSTRAAGRSTSASDRERVAIEPRHVCLLFRRFQQLPRRRDARLRARARGAPHPARAGRRALLPRARGGAGAAQRALRRSSGRTTSCASSPPCAARSSRSATTRCSPSAHRFRHLASAAQARRRQRWREPMARSPQALDVLAPLHVERNRRPLAETVARLARRGARACRRRDLADRRTGARQLPAHRRSRAPLRAPRRLVVPRLRRDGWRTRPSAARPRRRPPSRRAPRACAS